MWAGHRPSSTQLAPSACRVSCSSARRRSSWTAPLFDADEDHPLPRRPAGPYSATKAATEQLVLAANGDDIRTVVVRPPGIWGVSDPSILPALAALARRGQFVWFDHGRYPSSFCHVENVCASLLAAAERGRSGEAYFVTDGSPAEFREFVTELLRTQGVGPGGRSLPWGAVKVLAAGLEAAWRLARRCRARRAWPPSWSWPSLRRPGLGTARTTRSVVQGTKEG